MPLDIQEIIADGAQVGVFVQKVKLFAESLPKAGEPVSAKQIADGLASLLPELGALVDQIRADLVD